MTDRRKIVRRAALPALFAFLGVILAFAQPALAEDVIGVSKSPIVLEGSKGELVRLSRPAATVFIADPDVADVQVKSPRLIYVFGKKPGETTLYAVDGDEQVLLSRRVTVNHNLTRLRDALTDMLPDSRIDVRSVDGTVVLTGDVTDAREVEDARRLARKLVNDDDSLVTRIGVTAPNQVQLRVRVAEVSREILKDLGINWDSVMGIGKFAFGLATGNPILGAAAGGLGVIARNTVNAQTTNSLFGSFRSNGKDINGLVDALDREGLISILAEPNLTALSGEQATFLAGGEFPILVPQGNNTIVIEFKQFGVSLAFKPTLVDAGRISLKVNPEVSQLSNEGAVQINNFNIPALTTRRAQTTVELGSGQSFVIAGLLQNNITHDLSKFPGLGDLPIIGPLFRSSAFRRNETELVIIVTPYIVRPVSAPMLASPTDGLVPPTDTDRVLYGRQTGTRTGRAPSGPAGADGQGLVGSVGYVLD